MKLTQPLCAVCSHKADAHGDTHAGRTSVVHRLQEHDGHSARTPSKHTVSGARAAAGQSPYAAALFVSPWPVPVTMPLSFFLKKKKFTMPLSQSHELAIGSSFPMRARVPARRASLSALAFFGQQRREEGRTRTSHAAIVSLGASCAVVWLSAEDR